MKKQNKNVTKKRKNKINISYYLNLNHDKKLNLAKTYVKIKLY